MAITMFITANPKIMGKFPVSGFLKIVGWAATFVMAAAVAGMYEVIAPVLEIAATLTTLATGTGSGVSKAGRPHFLEALNRAPSAVKRVYSLIGTLTWVLEENPIGDCRPPQRIHCS
jgi:hypothetical protein